MQSGISRVVRFGVFEVDLVAGELRRNGTRVKLQEQPFQVLAALLERPGEIVTRDELQERIWKEDIFVDFEDGLSTAVRKIRQALADAASNPRFVETLPKRGYRFIASVEAVHPIVGSASPPQAVTPAPVMSSPRMIAALLLACALGGSLVWVLGEGESTRAYRRYALAPEALGAGLDQDDSFSAGVSPDGKKIVYLSDEQPPRLWLYRFDGSDSEPLADTEDASYMFWAPDSKSVGFSAGGAVRRVSIDGGSATTVCPLPNSSERFRGGSWSHDGERIVFSAPGGGMSLYSVSASGGQPEPLLAGGHDTLVMPQFLPGDSFLLAAVFNMASLEGFDTFIVDLKTSESSLLVQDARFAVYSSSGHVIYHREDSLWALPFSLDQLEAVGPPLRIAERLAQPTLSDDGTLVAVSHQPAADRMRLVVRDRNGNRLSTVGSPLYNAYNPAVSPDGQRVAVSASNRRRAANDIWVYEIGGPAELRLTSDPRHEDSPGWTPDGRRILFRAKHAGNRGADYFVADSTGGGETLPFFESGDREAEFDWSPDGKSLLYQVSSPGKTGSDLRFVTLGGDGRAQGLQPFLQTEFNEAHPQFSPDGEYVAYVSSASGEHRVYVCPFPACSPIHQVSPGLGSSPRWSPDGKELYWQVQNGLMLADVDMSRESPTNNVRELFDVEIVALHTFCYDVTPDGNFVIVEPIAEEDDVEARRFIHVTENWYEEFRNRE